MEQHPVAPKRRALYEFLIRLCDIVCYAAVLAGGFYAIIATPSSVTIELAGFEWLVYFVWGPLLILGGGLGLFGRISRVWMLEVPATVAGFAGVLIYLVVIGKFAFTSPPATVAVTLVLFSGVGLARRYLELQIFGEDPGVDDFRHRIAAALSRRTANAVAHK